MPTDLIHRIGIAAPAEKIYRALTLSFIRLRIPFGIASISPGFGRPPPLPPPSDFGETSRFGAARSDYPGTSSKKSSTAARLHRRLAAI
jgi:hypothetical protein